MSKTVACPENQAAFNHLSLVAARCLGGKRDQYRFSVLKVMKSLKLYPLPIESIEEALSLEGVGPALAKELMKAVNISKSEIAMQQMVAHPASISNGEMSLKGKNKSKPERSVHEPVEASPLSKRSKPCLSKPSSSVTIEKYFNHSKDLLAVEKVACDKRVVPLRNDIIFQNDFSCGSENNWNTTGASAMSVSHNPHIFSPPYAELILTEGTDSNYCSRRIECTKSKEHSLYLEIPESPCVTRSVKNNKINDGNENRERDRKNTRQKIDEHDSKIRSRNDGNIISIQKSGLNPNFLNGNKVINNVELNQFFDLTQDDSEIQNLQASLTIQNFKSKKIDDKRNSVKSHIQMDFLNNNTDNQNDHNRCSDNFVDDEDEEDDKKDEIDDYRYDSDDYKHHDNNDSFSDDNNERYEGKVGNEGRDINFNKCNKGSNNIQKKNDGDNSLTYLNRNNDDHNNHNNSNSSNSNNSSSSSSNNIYRTINSDNINNYNLTGGSDSDDGSSSIDFIYKNKFKGKGTGIGEEKDREKEKEKEKAVEKKSKYDNKKSSVGKNITEEESDLEKKKKKDIKKDEDLESDKMDYCKVITKNDRLNRGMVCGNDKIFCGNNVREIERKEKERREIDRKVNKGKENESKIENERNENKNERKDMDFERVENKRKEIEMKDKKDKEYDCSYDNSNSDYGSGHDNNDDNNNSYCNSNNIDYDNYDNYNDNNDDYYGYNDYGSNNNNDNNSSNNNNNNDSSNDNDNDNNDNNDNNNNNDNNDRSHGGDTVVNDNLFEDYLDLDNERIEAVRQEERLRLKERQSQEQKRKQDEYQDQSQSQKRVFEIMKTEDQDECYINNGNKNHNKDDIHADDNVKVTRVQRREGEVKGKGSERGLGMKVKVGDGPDKVSTSCTEILMHEEDSESRRKEKKERDKEEPRGKDKGGNKVRTSLSKISIDSTTAASSSSSSPSSPSTLILSKRRNISSCASICNTPSLPLCPSSSSSSSSSSASLSLSPFESSVKNIICKQKAALSLSIQSNLKLNVEEISMIKVTNEKDQNINLEKNNKNRIEINDYIEIKENIENSDDILIIKERTKTKRSKSNMTKSLIVNSKDEKKDSSENKNKNENANFSESENENRNVENLKTVKSISAVTKKKKKDFLSDAIILPSQPQKNLENNKINNSMNDEIKSNVKNNNTNNSMSENMNKITKKIINKDTIIITNTSINSVNEKNLNNLRIESNNILKKQKSNYGDYFTMDSSDEEENENILDLDDILVENRPLIDPFLGPLLGDINRSEERRVGKECRP